MRRKPIALMAGLLFSLLWLLGATPSQAATSLDADVAGIWPYGTADAVAYGSDGLIYVSNGMVVYRYDPANHTDPDTMAGVLDYLTFNSYVTAIQHVGNVTVAGLGNKGVNVSDTTTNTGFSVATDAYVYDVQFVGAGSTGTLYIADYTNGVRIVNVAPAGGVLGGTEQPAVDTTGWAMGLAVSGGNVYVADGASGLAVINNGAVTEFALPGGAFARSIAVSGTHAYIGTGTGLVVWDLSTNQAVGSFANGLPVTKVQVVGNLAYLAGGANGLRIVNVANPAAPVLVGTFPTAGEARSVAVNGTLAYVAAADRSLQVVDVTTPAAPTFSYALERQLTAGFNYDVRLHAADNANPAMNEYALVSGGYRGVRVINISTGSLAAIPAHEHGPFDFPFDLNAGDYAHADSDARDTAVSGDIAYVANGKLGLLVADIGAPLRNRTVVFNPSAIPPVNVPADHPVYAKIAIAGSPTCEHVSLSGGSAFLACGDAGLAIVPTSATIVANAASVTPAIVATPSGGYAYDVAVANGFAYVAMGAPGFEVVNVSAPANPTAGQVIDTPGLARGVFVAGNNLYVADDTNGLLVYSLANPASPTLVGTFKPAGVSVQVVAVRGYGPYIYALDTFRGVRVLDKAALDANPAGSLDAIEKFFYLNPSQAFGIDANKNTIAVADLNAGLHLITQFADASVAPVAPAVTATTAAGQVLSGKVGAFDLNSDETLAFAVAAQPAHGTAAIDANGTYTYTPAAGFIGADSFTYTVSDGTNTSTGTVSVTVSGTNAAPTTAGLTLTAASGQVASGTLTASDVNGDPLAFALATAAAHGTATVNANGTFTYTPAAGYSGPDAFTYTVSDGKGGTATGTVTITVGSAANTAPTTTGQSLTTTAGQAVSGTLIASDVDAGDVLTYSAPAASAAGGTVVVTAATGAFTYTPAANFTGADSFVYTVNDGKGGTATGTVAITVNAATAPPAGNANGSDGGNQPASSSSGGGGGGGGCTYSASESNAADLALMILAAVGCLALRRRSVNKA